VQDFGRLKGTQYGIRLRTHGNFEASIPFCAPNEMVASY